MLQDSTQRTFLKCSIGNRLPMISKQENRILLRATKSEIIFRTLDNPERLRGPNLAWFALDELTYAQEDSWTRLLGRLRHPQAGRLCGCAVWTPKGYDCGSMGCFLKKRDRTTTRAGYAQRELTPPGRFL